MTTAGTSNEHDVQNEWEENTQTQWQYCNFACVLDFLFSFFNLISSRWTPSLPSCLWSLRIFPSLPGSRLTFFYRDASSALLQLVNQRFIFTYSRSHAFRYERKNTNPTLVRIELLTASALTSRYASYLLDHSGDECYKSSLYKGPMRFYYCI